MTEDEEKEAAIREKYRKEIEEKVQRELNRIKEAEKAKQKAIQAERQAKESKRQMMEKIQAELNKIKALDNVRKVHVDEEKKERENAVRQEEERKAKEEEEKQRLAERNRKRLLDGIQAQRMEEEMKIREEARKQRLELEAKREMERKRREKEEEETRARALEEEKRRIAELEEEERRKKIEAEVQARREEARLVEEKIAGRKREEREREAQRAKELQERIARDNEALRKKELENKRKKFIKDQEDERKQQTLKDAAPKKRNSLQSNAILQKFELLSKAAAQKEEEEAARKRDLMKKNALKKIPKRFMFQEKVMKKSQNLLKKLTKNSDKYSKEDIKKSLNKLVQIANSKCQLMKDIQEESTDVTKRDMQNYLISQVLFDGNECVDTRERTPECDRKDAFFETYKEEMEKYLSLFDDDQKKTRGEKIKKTSKKVEVPFAPINQLKNQFEFPGENDEKKPTVQTRRKGKRREFNDVFRRIEEASYEKKKTYVPVIIDKEAFERTLGKFEANGQNSNHNNVTEEIGVSEDDEESSEEMESSYEEETKSLSEEDTEDPVESNDSLSSPQESNEDPVDVMRERIAQELSKIQQAEKQFNDKIAKENKRKELMIAIQEEISKINKMTQANDSDDPEEEPTWIQRFKDLSRIGRVDKVSSVDNADRKEEENEGTQEEGEVTEESTSSNLDYMATIEALLSLTEDNEDRRDIPKELKLSKKPITVKAVSDIKNKFENSQKSTPSKESDIQKDKGQKINFVKNILLKTTNKKDSTVPKTSKDTQSMDTKKKASRIKNMFEGKSSKENVKKRSPKRSTISVPSVFNAQSDSSLRDQKVPEQKEWKYKQKQMSNLGQFLQKNAESLPKDILHQGTRVLSNHNNSQPVFEKTEDLSQTSNNFLEEYLKENDGKETDSAFMETLHKYLDLIDKDEPRKSKCVSSIKLESTDIRALQAKLTNEETNGKTREKPKQIIGKIKPTVFEKTSRKEERSSSSFSNQGHCSDIKDHLEKKSVKKEDVREKIRRKKIIVQVNESMDDDIRLKNSGNNDWKWKKKNPEELWIENSETKKSVTQESEEENDLSQKLLSKEREDLIQRTETLKEKTQVREKEYEEFLRALRTYSKESSDQSSLQSQIGSYLQLIDEDIPKASFNLPDIDVPWKIDTAKSKLHKTSKKDKVVTPIPNLNTFSRMKDKMTRHKQPLQTLEKEPTPSSKPIHGIKNQFEEMMRGSGGLMKKSFSEMNLSPRRIKHRVPELVPQNNKEDSGKWHSKVIEYFQPEQIKPKSQKRVESKKIIKSKWEAIKDPEERKRAILEKHGFKPRSNRKQEERQDIQEDEDKNYLSEEAYKEYLKEHTGIDPDSGDEKKSHDNNNFGGSISSLLNILGSVRKSMIVQDSPAPDFPKTSRRAVSEIDISHIPGSCSNIKKKFETPEKDPIRNHSYEERKIPPRKLRKGSFDNLFKSESSTDLSVNSELEVLRSSGALLRRQHSETNLDSGRLLSERTPSSVDLDGEVMEELSKSNSAIKAMFEASAPKYKFGQKLSSEGGPKRNRPKRENVETRQWVLDSVNKFFDVIVEEEEEDEKNYSDSESDTASSQNAPRKSQSNMKNLLASALSKYKNVSRETLLSNFKRNLGSQLQLKRESMECLNV